MPGRFERVDLGQPFLVVVDYAHTDDALRNLLATARELHAGGRIITLFGCGGNRDRSKRPLMGEVAGRLSDVVVLSSDNPRGEDPLYIINDALVGLQRTSATVLVEPDRQRAIGLAMDQARAGDVVLLAGKGHETTQVLKQGTIPFDDREVARRGAAHAGIRWLAGPAFGGVAEPSRQGILCGGQFQRLLARCALRFPPGLTPWPGWPASRLTLAPWLRDSSSSPFRGLATTDISMWTPPCKPERSRRSSPRRAWLNIGESVRGRLIAVPDTLVALQDLARAVRRAWGRRIAAVTGSVGKTTTKEILAALLGAKFRVLKSEGNLNNEYGLPLALLRLEPEDEAAVVELGMSHRGELRRLAEIAEPDVGVVTQVAPVHLEFFSSVDEIALAKRELIEGLVGPETVAVLNADDPRVARFAEVARGRVLTFGFSPAAQFRAENVVDRGAEGSTFDFISPQGRAHDGVAAAGTPQHRQRAGCAGSGQRLGYRSRRSGRRVSASGRRRNARPPAALRRGLRRDQ